MTYNSFDRGRHPVGVRTDSWFDDERNRELPVEIWYPATDEVRGHDLDPQRQDSFAPGWVTENDTDVELSKQAAIRNAPALPGPHRLILLIHGWAGFRRESTFIGTHLASHGYIVVSPDVVLSTYTDVDAFLSAQTQPTDAHALHHHLTAIADARKGDITFLVDRAEASLDVNVSAVGITGASFGGWSSLQAPASDARIAAVVPMCPAGGRSPVVPNESNLFRALLDLDWKQPAATLLLAADRDALLPLDGQLELLRRVPTHDRQMVVLQSADHNHFVDDIDTGQEWLREFAHRIAALFPQRECGNWPLVAASVVPANEIVPGAEAHQAWRGLITAHMDAHLRSNIEARELLHGNISEALAHREIGAFVIDPRPATA